MNIPTFARVSLAAFFMTAGMAAMAQKSDAVWKKTVVRTIDLKVKEDDKKHHLKEAGNDKGLAEMMVTDVRAGKITAYSNIEPFSTKLSSDDLSGLFGEKPDTMTTTDPVTGREVTMLVKHDINYEALQKFRLLEEWTFNPSTGKTDIQITGIAPEREIYSDDGTLRGVQALFWLRYMDALPILNRYEQTHPNNNIAGHIWDDYFLSDVKPKKAK